jgi:hypothetical protein
MPYLLAEIDPSWLFLAGCALLTFVLLKRTARRVGGRRKKSAPPLEHLPRPQNAWDGSQRDAQSQLDRQKVEIYEMARELSGQLNTKILVLEKLIADGQQQIDRLESLLERQEERSLTGADGDREV